MSGVIIELLGLPFDTEMHRERRIFVAQFFAVFASCMMWIVGCGANYPSSKVDAKLVGAKLTTAEVVFIAEKAAEKEGARLSEFKKPVAHYEFTVKDRTWVVFFDGRIPMPGNHFTVYVDDRTKETRFIGGR